MSNNFHKGIKTNEEEMDKREKGARKEEKNKNNREGRVMEGRNARQRDVYRVGCLRDRAFAQLPAVIRPGHIFFSCVLSTAASSSIPVVDKRAWRTTSFKPLSIAFSVQHYIFQLDQIKQQQRNE